MTTLLLHPHRCPQAYLAQRTGVRLVQHLTVDVSACGRSSSSQSLHHLPGQQTHTLLLHHCRNQTEGHAHSQPRANQETATYREQTHLIESWEDR